MSIIGGGISIADTIGNVVKVVKSKRSFDDEIRKALEKVTNDDFQRQRLITLSSDILHFAVRKLNNEKIILPPYIDENEFNDFYDRMRSNKETCLFLQTQLQNYKIDKISQKLDDIYAAIKISGLRSYENVLDVNVKRRFLDEASENLIKEKKLYFNELYINKVKNCLDDRKDCLIKAPEGRGKTYLSRIIAYEYHHEHRMEVWFLDFKDENDANSKISIENLDDQMKAWHEFKEKNYLLVLENVHAYSDVNGLQKKINDWIDTADNHIRFLLNARPTDEGLVDFSGWEDTMVELMPNDTDINAIIDLYSEEIGRPPFASQEERGGFLKRIYPEGNNSIGANLRLLNIYLKTWQDHLEKTYISDIDEPTILKDFIKRYKLEKVTEEDIKVLHYISCIYQFDVPFHIDLIPIGRSNSLQKFKGKGLLRKVNSTYHLPHSVDALYLSKAISLYYNKVNYLDEYLENTKLFVKQFVDAILASSNPRKFEGDFILLVSGLMARKEEFRDIIMELTEWNKAKEIIMKINSGFIIQMLHTENGHSIDSLRNILDSNIDTLRPYILELSPSLLTRLCSGLENHLKYKPEEIYSNIFNNPADLRNYLAHWSAIYNVTGLRHFFFTTKSRRIIKAKHALVCEEFHNSNKQKRNNEQSYDFVFIKEKDQKNLISNASFLKYDEYNKTKFQHFISKLSTEGFYINELNWRQLNLFLRKMGDCIDEAHIKSFQQVANTLVEMIIDKDNVFFEKPNAFEKISSAHLSHFLFNLSRVDNNLYNVIILNDKIIETVKQKLDELETITIDEIIDYLYLFSYFYSQPWCEARMNNFIDKANEEQQSRTKEWHDKIMAKLDNNEEQIEKDSLLAYIHNKPFIQQQNN